MDRGGLMCGIENCEPWAIYNDSHPTARVEHGCCECWRRILPGERYLRAEGLCDGAWLTYKVCRHCEALSRFMVVLCDGWPFGDLYTELIDHWREGYASMPLGRLIVAMRKKWRGGTDAVPTGIDAMAHELMRKAVAV